MRIYLDASPVICLVERVHPYAGSAASILGASHVKRVCSQLTRMECRVHPIRSNNQPVLSQFDAFFAAAIDEYIPLTAEVIDQATHIRATYNFKVPDALHLASAVVSGCDALLTNDHKLQQFDGLEVLLVQ